MKIVPSDDSHQTRVIQYENSTLKTQPRAPLPHINMSQNAPIGSLLHRTKVESLLGFELWEILILQKLNWTWTKLLGFLHEDMQSKPVCRQRFQGGLRLETWGNPEKIPLGGAEGSRTPESMPCEVTRRRSAEGHSGQRSAGETTSWPPAWR